MQCRGIPIALLLVLAGTAAAQAQPAIAPVLQDRLAYDAAGVVLARRDLGVAVEELASHYVVSLVDLATGRVVASSTVRRSSPDAEAAAIMRTILALEAQILKPGAPAAPEPAAPLAAPLPDGNAPEARAELARRQTAELVFRQHALRFGTSDEAGAHDPSGPTQQWRVFRGHDQELDPEAFYQAVGRGDLAESYRRRHFMQTGSYLVSGLATAVAILLTFRHSDLSACNGLAGDVFDRCVAGHGVSLAPALAAVSVGLVGAAVGTYLLRNPHPIDDNDAKALADAYNQRLRRQLGLPVAVRPSILRDVAVRPEATEHGAKLAFEVRF